MKAKVFFKKIAAFALAGTMVLGSAMVTLADVENADVETYTATDDSVNSQGYKPGKVYYGDENVFNAKGEALPGYEWDSVELTPHVDGYYDHEQDAICGKEEHAHSAYGGDCYTQKSCDIVENHTHQGNCYEYKTCDQEEHTHTASCKTIICGKEEHKHTWSCVVFPLCHKKEHTHSADCDKIICGKTEHTHSKAEGGCSEQKLICSIPENHTHSTEVGGCMEYVLNCDKEHAHVDECYPYVEPVLATYKFQMKPIGDTENGNKKITISIHVDCQDGQPANGVDVGITAHDDDFGWIAEQPTIEKSGETDFNGNVVFKISGTYDSITDISINGTSVGGYDKRIGCLINNSVSLSYSVEHDFKEDSDSAEDTKIVDNAVKVGKYADKKCVYCEAVQTGETHTCATLKGYLLINREIQLDQNGKSMSTSYFKPIGVVENGVRIEKDADGKETATIVDGATDLLIAQNKAAISALLQSGENFTDVTFGRLQHEKDGWHADFYIAKSGSGDQGGSTGGDQGGSTGGDQGGSTGGDQGGSTGGDQGGSAGGDQGGSAGGDQGGSAGGDQGGSTGGDQGGNTGDQGGSTGGDQGGSTGGDQGGSAGGDQGGNTGDQGGSTGDNGNNGGNTNTGDNGNNGGNTNTGDNGNNGGNTNTGDNGNNGGNTNAGDNGNNGGNTNAGDNGNNGGNTNAGDNGNNGGNTNRNNNTNTSRNNNTPANNNTSAANRPVANNAANNAPAAVNNNAGNTPIVVANNDAAANADNADDAVVIDDEQTPLAANDQNVDEENNSDEQQPVTIDDEATPLAAAEDNCFIHWIILILTLLAGGYSLVRAFVRIRKESEEAEKEF